MSVLIDMDMPKVCNECPFCCNPSYFAYAWCELLQQHFDMDESYNKVADFCPITEVPTPHGELVDRGILMDTYADRLTAVAERYSPDSSECGILSGAMKLLAIQPTVIEAED